MQEQHETNENDPLMLNKKSMSTEKEKIKNNKIKIKYVSTRIFAIQKINFHRVRQD